MKLPEDVSKLSDEELTRLTLKGLVSLDKEYLMKFLDKLSSDAQSETDVEQKYARYSLIGYYLQYWNLKHPEETIVGK